MSKECDIVEVGKSRNGKFRYWCMAHGANATGRYGTRLQICEGAYLAISEADCFDLDGSKFPGGIGVWGAVEPIYNTSSFEFVPGVHVHARMSDSDDMKSIDKTFPAIRLSWDYNLFERKQVIIDQQAAVNYLASRYLDAKIDHLFCSHCGAVHLDSDYFAVHPHRRHLCHACGKYFSNGERGISNPVAFLRKLRDDSDENRMYERATEVLQINQADHPGGIQIWASNPAILWTVPRPEKEGLHVHVFGRSAQTEHERCKDDTFGKVIIDDICIDENMARQLMIQNSLPYLKNKIDSLYCPDCLCPHFDAGIIGFSPHKEHICENCGGKFVTPGKRRLVVSNPLRQTLTDLQKNSGQ